MKLTDTLLILSLILAACSSDNQATMHVDNSKSIEFTASIASNYSATVAASRDITSFSVSAYAGALEYMGDIRVTKNAEGRWTHSPTLYWPVDRDVEFYSCSPSGITLQDNTGDHRPDIPSFYNDGDIDLLYAVNMDMNSTDREVKICFRHALAQVAVMMKRKQYSDPHAAVRIEVKGVELINIATVGDFHFPEETTSSTSSTIGEWTDERDYTNVRLYYNAKGAVSLADDTPRRFINSSNSYELALPQIFRRDSGDREHDGAYLRVLCAVYNAASEMRLWPSDTAVISGTGCGYLYFPLFDEDDPEAGWDMGRKYVYTLTVGSPLSSREVDRDMSVDEYKEFDNDI